MAVKFLSNLSLEQNQLLNASLQQVASDPAGFTGQIIFNTTSNTFKYYNGSAWINLDGTGDISAVIAGNGLTGGGTSGSVTLNVGAGTGISVASTTVGLNYTGASNFVLSATNLTGIDIAPSDVIIYSDATDNNIKKGLVADLPFTDNLGTVTSVNTGNSTFISGSGGPITTSGALTFSLSATGTPSSSTYLRGDNTWSTIPATYSGWTLLGDTGTPQAISSGNTARFVGGEGIDTAASATDTLTVTLDLTELPARTVAITPATDKIVGLFAGGTDQNVTPVNNFTLNMWGAPTADVSFNNKKITLLLDPTSSQDAATKNYVDTTLAGSGALIYQGGYAATAAPNGSAKKGWTYAVTVAGNGAGYFTTTLEVGDLIIANVDNPASEADWTEINKNIDVATATITGIASFPTTGGLSVTGGAVSMPDVVTAGTVGSATQVGQITVDAKGRVTARTNVNIAIPSSQVTNFTASVESIVNSYKYSATIGNGVSTSINVIHALGTFDVIVQLYDTTTYETLYADVVRSDADSVTITTTNPIASGGARVLITKA